MSRLLIVIPGNPGDGRVNGWKTPIIVGGKKAPRARMIEGAKYKAWKAKAAACMRAAAGDTKFAGPLVVEVRAYWPRKHNKGPAKGLPFGDVDAMSKATLDALESSGVVASDAQVMSAPTSKAYDKENPRVEVEVYPLESDPAQIVSET